MLCNGTDSDFNSLVWIPSHALPSISTLLRSTSPTTLMVDLDIAEHLLNSCLHLDATRYVGIELTPIFVTKGKVL